MKVVFHNNPSQGIRRAGFWIQLNCADRLQSNTGLDDDALDRAVGGYSDIGDDLEFSVTQHIHNGDEGYIQFVAQ